MSPQTETTAQTDVPDLVVAVYGNGTAEARMRGIDAVVASAADVPALLRQLKRQYPQGFSVDLRYDPHM